MATIHHSTPWRGARAKRAAALALGTSLALAATMSSVNAEKVGVAAAVNPDAFSSLSGTPNQQLNIGKSIFYNERINTTNSGLVQVLLVDGSTFTVGPNSNLVIDRFVYDPRKKTGQVVATFSKGAMRFVGGKISKNEGGVTVKTPAGALAIRGGMFQASLSGNRGVFSFLFGNEMRLGNQRVFQPGYTIDTTSGTPTVRPTTRADINGVMAALTNSNTNGFGSTETEQPDVQPDQLAETISLQDLISDATETRIVDSLEAEEKKEIPTTTTTTTTTEDPSPPDPVQVTFRVLGTPGAYTAFPGTDSEYTTDNGSGGVLGGGNYGNPPPGPPLADDFTWTFSIVDGRFVGTVSGLLDANCTDSNCQTIETHTISQAKVDFPASFPAATCEDGICPVTNAKITQDGVTRNYAGIAVLKQDFFAYQVMAGQYGQGDFVIPTNPNEPDPLLLIGGTGHQFEAPSGKIYVFQLGQDITQPGSFGPFASANSTPQSGDGNITPLLALEQDSGGAESLSRPVWLQTSFVIGDGESTGQSFVNIALGEWNTTEGISGSRRGGSDVDGANYSFSGDIASLAGPDGSHFLGTENPNVVIGADSTGSHDIFRDTPLNPGQNNTAEDQSGATYHIGIGTGSVAAEEFTQTTSTFKGFAAGFVTQPGNGSPDTLMNTSANDVEIVLNAETNTMTAALKVGNGLIGDVLPNPRYDLQFGGEGNSAFIDDKIFAAFEKPGASSVEETVLVPRSTTYFEGKPWEFTITSYHLDDKTYVPEVESYIASADAINANAVLFSNQTVNVNGQEVQKQAFCQDCNFIKWGAWGARMNYENYDEQHVTEDVHLGWWIAGDPVPASDLDKLQAGGATATYSGDAIGTVARKLDDGGWNQYVATGQFDADWKFAKRRGDFTISNFDGKNFGGRLHNPAGTSSFSTKLLDGRNLQNGIATQANGSFVGSRPGQAPGGMIGNFQADQLNGKWKANGIFGGTPR